MERGVNTSRGLAESPARNVAVEIVQVHAMDSRAERNYPGMTSHRSKLKVGVLQNPWGFEVFFRLRNPPAPYLGP